jgi:pimeloyl-ACP methyl ester carboxylesterase
MPTITTDDGTRIYYEHWGNGAPVVFSHGWPPEISPALACEIFALAYRTLHLEVDESLEFDAIFHRKLAYQVIHKAIYRQTHRLPFA